MSEASEGEPSDSESAPKGRRIDAEAPPPKAAEAALSRGDFRRARELARAAGADPVLARLRPDRAGLAIAAAGLVLFAVLFCYYALGS